MTVPAIQALAIGVPDARYTQAEIAEYFINIASQRQATRRARAMRTIFERAGVSWRHFVTGDQFFLEERSTAARNELYMREAVPLGEATIRRGLDAAGLAPTDIDDLIIVSCTGFSTPGLDLQLAARLGMRPDLRRSCILSMGCYGAFPGLLRAQQSVSSALDQERRALVLALELCSVHMQFDDSTENVVTSALFGDGAAMAVIGSQPGTINYPRLVRSATRCDYTTFEHMTFTISDTGFRMYLSSYVPELLGAQIGPFVDDLLAGAGLIRGDITHWGIHPGGVPIIDHVQRSLDLTDAQVAVSHHILNEFGNMSSATILFVLDYIQRCNKPQSHDYGVLMAFGPGLTMEGLLVQW
jgi:predicted naringenin-chalcone synthase